MLALSGVLVILVIASGFDVIKRQIPNSLVGGLLVCLLLSFPSYWLSMWLSLMVGGTIWFLSMWGGGDAKLAAALSIAIPTSALLNAWIVTLYVGGLLAVFCLVKNRINGCESRGIPYGIAISIGFFSQILLCSMDVA